MCSILWLYRLIPFRHGWQKELSYKQKFCLTFAWNLARNTCCIALLHVPPPTTCFVHPSWLHYFVFAPCVTHTHSFLGLICASIMAAGSSYLFQCSMPCINSINLAKSGASFDAASIPPPSLFRWVLFFRRKAINIMMEYSIPLAPCQGILRWLLTHHLSHTSIKLLSQWQSWYYPLDPWMLHFGHLE